MKILFLTDNFPPEVNAPASRTFEHCRRWVELGHEVTVVTCAPNFPQGKVFDGYRNRLWQTEQMDGIRVVRVWSFITANEGFVRRILDYLSYMASAMISALFLPRCDVVVATSPQFFTLCAGWFAALVHRRPWVLELRDIWPESIKAVGAMRDSLVLRVLERIEMFLYRSADRIVVVSDAFKPILTGRGIAADKIDVVTNGVDLSAYTPRDGSALRSSLGLDGKFLAGYIGTHGMAHALETLLDSAALAAADRDEQDVHFVFVGDGASKQQMLERAAEAGLANVTFLPSVAKDRVADFWSILDVAVIHLKDTQLFRSVIPSKIFECMAMGIPMLVGVRGQALAIVEGAGAGIAFEPENPHGLLQGMSLIRRNEDLRRSLSEAGLAASSRYDRRNLAEKMLAILERVAAR